MGLWSSLTGKKSPPEVRELTHPSHLKVGDFIRFGFCAQSALSNQSFEVVDVTGLEYATDYDEENDEYQTTCRHQFVLQGGTDEKLLLSVLKEGFTEALTITRLFPAKTLVGSVLERQELSPALDPESDNGSALHCQIESTEDWLTDCYYREGAFPAYSYAEDIRERDVNDIDNVVEQQFFLFVSESREQMLDVFVYAGGRTEFYFGVRLPVEKIEDMWPASQQKEE
jgi:hypothetical protein